MTLTVPASSARLAVFGAGGFTVQLIDLLDRLACAGRAIVLVDDRVRGERFGYSVIGADGLLPGDAVAIAVANGAIRQRIAERLPRQAFEPLIDARADLSAHAAIGEGVIAAGGARVEPGVRIGHHCHLNVAALIAHETVLGDFVTIAPHACVNGNVAIGNRAYIGAGAVIRQGRPGAPLVIGADAVVGMGAVVTRDVPPGSTIYGNPARASRRD